MSLITKSGMPMCSAPRDSTLPQHLCRHISSRNPSLIIRTCRVAVLGDDVLLLLGSSSLVETYSRKVAGRFTTHALRQLLVDMLRTATSNRTSGEE